MDCNFITAEGRFNFRAAAVISHGGRLLGMRESFFVLGERPVHEIAMYYLAEMDWCGLPSLREEFTLADSDGEEHNYRWLTVEEVRSARIYPVPMQKHWPELPGEFTFFSDVRDRRSL